MGIVLKHAFSNVSKMKLGDIQKSKEVCYAGVKWSLSMQKKLSGISPTFVSSLRCNYEDANDWYIDASRKFQLLSSGAIRQEETDASTFKKDHLKTSIQTHESNMLPLLVDDRIVLKCHVNINDLDGIPMEKLNLSDESLKTLADLTLAVGHKKFYVTTRLEDFSSYFKSLFPEGFEESGKEIIELKNVNPAHFEVYLKAIYGVRAINDSNVEKTLELAEKYGSPVITKTCEAHLMSSSCKLSTKTKIRLSGRFKLKRLFRTLLDSSKSLQEIRSLLPADLGKLDPILAKSILQRVLKMPSNQ